MAYVRDPKLIIDKMKSEDIKYFTVFDSDGKSIIDQQDDENCTSNEAQDRLQDLLFNIEGLVHVVLRTTTKKVRALGGDLSSGTYKFSIRCSESGTKSIGLGSTGHNAYTGLSEILKLQAEKHQLEIQGLKTQFEFLSQIQDLKREMKEAQEGDSTEKWLPILQQFITNPNMTKAAPKVALAGTEEKPSDDRKLILQDAITRLYKIDPELHNNLAKLAAFAEENPTKYSLYLNML